MTEKREQLISDLRAALGSDVLRSDPDITAGYARDTADLVAGGVPLAVVSPRSVEAVQTVMRWASRERVPVLPRGAGTGLSGGAVCSDGWVVLDLTRLDRIEEIDVLDRLAVVQAGVINAAVSNAARPFGLMYAPDPSSYETSTIGGNLATNAGGLRCIRYGATRASVLGLDVVLADGRLLRTGGRTTKRSAGYDLTQLLVGSEGTLGVIVSATLRLHPLPAVPVTALMTFGATPAAAATASVLVHSGPPASLLELMDAPTVRAIDDYRGTGFGSDVGAVLLCQVDDVAGATALVERIAREQGATDVMTTTDDAEASDLLDIRRSAYHAVEKLGHVLVEDVAVPCSRLAELVAAIEGVASESGVRIATVAHAGDGNTHPLLVRPDGADADDRLWAAADRIFTTAMELGGTVSGEHGVGRLKRRWLEREVGDTSIELQRSIKAAFDPNGILNPGAILS